MPVKGVKVVEYNVQLLFAALFLVFLVYLTGRILLKPLRLLFKLMYNSLIGLILLWAANLLGGGLGLYLPVNWVTVAIAGFLGIPGLIFLILMYVLMSG